MAQAGGRSADVYAHVCRLRLRARTSRVCRSPLEGACPRCRGKGDLGAGRGCFGPCWSAARLSPSTRRSGEGRGPVVQARGRLGSARCVPKELDKVLAASFGRALHLTSKAQGGRAAPCERERHRLALARDLREQPQAPRWRACETHRSRVARTRLLLGLKEQNCACAYTPAPA